MLSFDLVLDTTDARLAFLAKIEDPSFCFLMDFHSWLVKRPTALACQAR